MTDAERAKNLADSMSLMHDKLGTILSYDHIEEAFLYGIKIERERRAADLTAADVEPLERIRSYLQGSNYDPRWTSWGDCIAVLDKLIAGASR